MPSQLMICSIKPRNSTPATSTHRFALIKAKKRFLILLALTFAYLLPKINISFVYTCTIYHYTNGEKYSHNSHHSLSMRFIEDADYETTY